MRIWLLTSEIPQEISAGIARYVETWARVLGAAGHEVVILAHMRKPCDTTLAPGVRLIGVVPRDFLLNEPNPGGQPDTHPAYPYNIFAHWPAFSYQLAEEVIKLLQHLPPPDVIESQEYVAIPYFLLQRKLTENTPLKNVPILVHLHSPSFELSRVNQVPRYRFPEYWEGQMEKFCIAAADALHAPTRFAVRRIEHTLGRSLDVNILPHPMLSWRAAAPQKARPRRLVAVGRVQVLKGVLPLVKACSRLWAAGEDFVLTFIGSDADFWPKGTTVATYLRERYARWVDEGRLRFTGKIESDEEMWNQVEQSWALVVASLWESCSYVTMEAMGMGQVVLASQSGGQAELIEHDGINGFLFDWDTPGHFERQLRRVLALSEEERRTVAHNAQARIRSLCDPQVILPKRLQHYEAVVARHSPRRLFPTVNTIPDRLAAVDQPVPSPALPPAQEQPGLLSVIIPFYNLGDYLLETVESVLAAAYAPSEIVIVNDGSTEPQSLAVLREIESRRLPHVRIVHTENQGLASARQVGAEAARGEFLALVDADDMVEPDFFQRAVDVLQRYENVSVACSWLRFFGESNVLWPTWNGEFPYQLGHNMIAIIAVARRAAFLRAARNATHFEYNFEDYEAWLALLDMGGVTVSLPYPLARYRIRADSMFRKANRDQFLYLYDMLTQYHPERYREWGVELFNLQNANGAGRTWFQPAQLAGEPPQEYVAALERQRDQLQAEIRTLGEAWEDQYRYITSQRDYIENLERRCNELVVMSQANAIQSLSNGNGISWREYEIGGKAVSRIRKTWVARQVLRSPLLKQALKKALRIGARLTA
jgi:glycogen synthase